MTAAPFVRSFLAEAARNPVNAALLIAVPVVFVAVAAKSMADSAELLGTSASVPAVQTATAGWSAGFIAAIAMYFQLRTARATDRRLVIAGLSPARLVTARMATGLVVALVAAAAALVTLELRTTIDHPGRVVAGTLMFAVIYLAVGALVGSLVAGPVNGTVLVLFVWLLDIVFGPAFGSADRPWARGFPTHFVTLWMIGLPSHHSGRIGDLGWALVWTAGSLALSWLVITATTRVARPRRHSGQLAVSLRMGVRGTARNPVLWVLLIVVPAAFVLLAKPTTPRKFISMRLREGGGQVWMRFWFPDVHPGIMAPVAIASLAAIAGLFTVLDARSADRRLTLAGMRPLNLLISRLTVIALLALLATGTSLALTATAFHARQWGLYIAANVLIALTYALIGVVIGALFGRVGGVFLAFLLPFLDLGLTQDPMLRPVPPTWARALPGYGGSRVMYDALTPSFDELGSLLIALAWLAGLALVTVAVFRHITGASGRATGLPTALPRLGPDGPTPGPVSRYPAGARGNDEPPPRRKGGLP